MRFPECFFCWTFPGAPIRIELHLDVIARLKQEVSGPAETGGILLGKRISASPCIVQITDFQPFPHFGGPHYVLSGAERHALGQMVCELRRSKPAMAVGFYRSHLRSGLFLDRQDLAMIRKCFVHPSDVFLVLRPEPHGAATAGFFFWDDGEIHGDFSFLEFPLDADELREATTPGTHRKSRLGLMLSAAGLIALAAAGLIWLAAT
jgi:hypothetical protein